MLILKEVAINKRATRFRLPLASAKFGFRIIRIRACNLFVVQYRATRGFLEAKNARLLRRWLGHASIATQSDSYVSYQETNPSPRSVN